ncbi:MAG: hypothetical protein N7Q72_02110 [Spiroplasma sp. Tabriz.8]|nr:hypothetical protein [Spiroplasma sp. Tabriz.8]
MGYSGSLWMTAEINSNLGTIVHNLNQILTKYYYYYYYYLDVM